MFYTTHLLFADIVYKHLRCKMEIKKYSFRYGNIKPDMSTQKINMPHTIEGSMEYLIQEINLLVNEVNNIRKLRTRVFARRLGIINHYLADYFCRAHNKAMIDSGLITHLLYEKKLAKLCKKNNIKNVQHNYNLNEIAETGCTSIKEYILYMHNNYCKETPGFAVDISYALHTCIVINNSIINTCIENCKNKKAA